MHSQRIKEILEEIKAIQTKNIEQDVADEFKTAKIDELFTALELKIKEVKKTVNRNEKKLVPKDH